MEATLVRGQTVYRKEGVCVLRLKVTKAQDGYRCRACGKRIEQGELHASTGFWSHYCASCVATERPA